MTDPLSECIVQNTNVLCHSKCLVLNQDTCLFRHRYQKIHAVPGLSAVSTVSGLYVLPAPFSKIQIHLSPLIFFTHLSLQLHCKNIVLKYTHIYIHIYSSYSSFVDHPGYGVTEGCFCPEGETLLSEDSNTCVSECCK